MGSACIVLRTTPRLCQGPLAWETVSQQYRTSLAKVHCLWLIYATTSSQAALWCIQLQIENSRNKDKRMMAVLLCPVELSLSGEIVRLLCWDWSKLSAPRETIRSTSCRTVNLSYGVCQSSVERRLKTSTCHGIGQSSVNNRRLIFRESRFSGTDFQHRRHGSHLVTDVKTLLRLRGGATGTLI